MEKQRRILSLERFWVFDRYFAEHFAKKEAGLNIIALICYTDSGWTA